MADTAAIDYPTQLKALIGSPTFQTLAPDVQQTQVAAIMSTSPTWKDYNATQRNGMVGKAIEQYGTAGPDASKATPKVDPYAQFTPEQRKQMFPHEPSTMKMAEDLLPLAGQVGGEILGGMGGAAAAGPIGALPGAMAGAAAGQTAGAAIPQELHHLIDPMMARDPADKTPNVAAPTGKEMGVQAAIGAGTVLAGPVVRVIGKGISKTVGAVANVMSGRKAIGEAVTKIGDEAAAAQEKFVEKRLSEDTKISNELIDQVNKDKANSIGEAKQKSLDRTAKRTQQGTLARRAPDPVKLSADTAEPSPQHLGWLDQMRHDIYSPIQRSEAVVQKGYADLVAKHGKQELAGDPARAYLKDKKDLIEVMHTSGAKKLVKEADAILNPEGVEQEVSTILDAEGKPMPKAAKAPKNDFNYQQLHNLRSEAARVAANSAANSPERSFANGLRQTLDNIADHSGIEGLKELNAKWRYFHGNFDPIKEAMYGSVDPIKDSKALFSNPDAAHFIASVATDAEKDSLRQLFYHFANSEGGPEAAFWKGGKSKAYTPMLNELFAGSPNLTRPEGWMHARDLMTHFEQVAKDVPEVRNRFEAAQQKTFYEAADKYANGVLEDADKMIEKMGPQGEQVRKAISQAGDKQARAMTAVRLLYKMDPKKVMADALRGGTEQTPFNLLTKSGIPGIPKYIGDKATLFMVAAMMGARSGYMAAMGVGGGLLGMQDLMTGGMKWALKHGVVDADKFVANIGKPLEGKALDAVGNLTARGLISTIATNIGMSGEEDEKPDEPKAPPVAKTKAEGISMQATGSPKLASLSSAPIGAAIAAYNTAKNEDMSASHAATLRSLILAKVRDGGGVAKLAPQDRLQLANIMKEADSLDQMDTERSDARGVV